MRVCCRWVQVRGAEAPTSAEARGANFSLEAVVMAMLTVLRIKHVHRTFGTSRGDGVHQRANVLPFFGLRHAAAGGTLAHQP